MSVITFQVPPGEVIGELVSSSPVPCIFLRETTFSVPRALRRSEIYEIIDRFALAAERARQAGYDMVELHGAHGYLISSFISPYMNKRTDEFGGTLEDRMRFTLGIIRRIKDVVGNDYPLGIRISGDEFIEGGITTEESPIVAKMLEDAGAMVINVSSGIYETLNKSNDVMCHTEGWKEYIWQAVKGALKIPTIAGGGLRTPQFCEKLLSEGKADFVGLGRALLADPEWPNKAAQGKTEDICKCISCLECLFSSEAGFRRPTPRCTVNACWGRQRDFCEIKPAPTRKKIMVVGGGPGGMEVARITALRGHDVTLYEKRPELGGQLLLASKPPGKEKILWLRDFLVTQLKKLGVKIKLNAEVDLNLVEQVKPDAVVLASGSEPRILDIPGINDKKVATAVDVLAGKVKLRRSKVVIIGGSMVGCETARYLVEQGNDVTIVEMLPRMANDMEPLNRVELMRQLEERGVIMLTEHVAKEVSEAGVVAINSKIKDKRLIEADSVILAAGAQPVAKLKDCLESETIELYAIGDCVEPRRILKAIYEGDLVGRKI